MSSIHANRIRLMSDHPRVQEVADHVSAGLSFGQILSRMDLSKETLAKIHYIKSSMIEALKLGTPVEQVVNDHFSDPLMRKRIMNGISKYKSKFIN